MTCPGRILYKFDDFMGCRHRFFQHSALLQHVPRCQIQSVAVTMCVGQDCMRLATHVLVGVHIYDDCVFKKKIETNNYGLE